MSLVRKAYSEVFDDQGYLKGRGSVAMPFFSPEDIMEVNEAGVYTSVLLQRVGNRIDTAIGSTHSIRNEVNFRVFRSNPL